MPSKKYTHPKKIEYTTIYPKCIYVYKYKSVKRNFLWLIIRFFTTPPAQRYMKYINISSPKNILMKNIRSLDLGLWPKFITFACLNSLWSQIELYTLLFSSFNHDRIWHKFSLRKKLYCPKSYAILKMMYLYSNI